MAVINENVKLDITLADGTEISLGMAEITGNFTISSQAVSSSSFELGGVCSSQLNASFKLKNISGYKMLGAVIKPQIYKNNAWLSLGVFNVTSSNRYRGIIDGEPTDIITVSASDNLIWLDKAAFTVDENAHKVNSIADYLHSRKSIYQLLRCVVEDIGGLELAQNQAEIEAMPNGDLTTIVFDDVKTDCPRDWLSWIAESLGGFAYADGNGRIGIRQFAKESTASISKDMIQLDSLDIADFRMYISKVEMDVWNGTYGAYYTSHDNQPNTIYVNLSDNWIVQGKHYLYGNAMDILGGVYRAINIQYRPFKATVHTDTLYYIGQCISIEDYDGTIYDTVITHHTYTFNGGQKIECAGADSRLLSQTKQRTPLKRESERLQTMIENARGFDVTEEEFDRIIQSGKYRKGDTFYFYGDESE